MKKKVLAMLCVGAMAVSLAACGSSSSSDTATDAAPAEETTETAATSAEEETSAPAETVATDGQTYKIGICQLVQHEALDAATRGFEDAMTEKLGDAVTFDLQNASGDSAVCATITNQFVADGDDLIMANATAALQAAAASTDSIPVLGTSITDYATALDIDDWTGVVGNNISGTSDLPPIDQQADLIQEIFPDATNIGVLYCSAEPNSIYQADLIRGYLEDMGYTVTDYTFADTNDVSSVTTTACASSDVLYIPTDNTAASCMESIANVATPAGVPAIVGWEDGLNNSVGVATLSIDYYDLGYQTGLMAVDILTNGADVSTMEISTAPEVTKKYNKANCEAFGVEISADDFEEYVAAEE